MAKIPVPVFRISGANGLVTFLYVLVMFGTLHLLATSHPENRLAQAWLSLNF